MTRQLCQAQPDLLDCSICPIVFNVYERLKDELWQGSDDIGEEEWDWDAFAEDHEDPFGLL